MNTFSEEISWATTNFWSHHCSQRGYENLINSEELGQGHDGIEILDSDSEEEDLDLCKEICSADTLQKYVAQSHVLGVMKKASSNVEDEQKEEATSSLPEESIEEEQNVDEPNQSYDDLCKKDVDTGTVPETIMERNSNFEETNLPQHDILPQNYISSSQTTLRSFSALQSPSRSGTMAISETPFGI